MMRRLAQGHNDSQLGGAGDRTRNYAVSRQPAVPLELVSFLDYFPSVRKTWKCRRLWGNT